MANEFSTNKWTEEPGISEILAKLARIHNIYPAEVVEIVNSFFDGLQTALNADVGTVKVRRIGTFTKNGLRKTKKKE